tara:strand:- start:50 stop:271 length:222 start_codon:yes stop_codon:yes gene_type:complete
MENPKENLTFESAIEELEVILKKLENENTPLDEMVDLYERANTYAQICKDKLNKADKKMTKLINDKEGNLTEE